jgi:methane monooxygenase component C
MQAEGHPRMAKLFFGVTHDHELFYADELKKLEPLMPALSVHIAVTEPVASWQESNGAVVDGLMKHFENLKIAPDTDICGSPGMAENGIADKIFKKTL